MLGRSTWCVGCVVGMALAVWAPRANADPSLSSTVTSLGNGLYALDLFVNPNDALNGSMAVEIELGTVAGGTFIHSSPTSPTGLAFNGGSPNVDRKSVAQNITMFAADPTYNQSLDSWWDDTVWVQLNPPFATATGATGGQAGSNYYAFSAGTGGGSMITGPVALGRMIVRDPLIHFDSVLARAGTDYVGAGYVGATDYKLWNNPAGGSFQTGGEWLLPGTPGAADDAVFSLANNYTVSFGGAATTERLLVRKGNVTFDLNGSTYNVVGAGPDRPVAISDYAGDNGALTITDGTLTSGTLALGQATGSTGSLTIGAGGLLSNAASTVLAGDAGGGSFTIQSGGDALTKNVQLGNLAGSNGTLSITGSGSTLSNNTELNIGNGGAGSMTISAGGSLTNVAGYLGRLSNAANGNATVTGAGSLWTNTGLLHVGELGSGSLSVLAGGVVTSPTGQLASQTGSTGGLTIDGTNSRWTVATTLEIGTRGTATATVSNGGRLESATGLVGTQAGSNGTTTVTGANSRWTNTSDLRIGSAGQGTLNVSSGGTVTNINAFVGNSSGSSGNATLSGAGSNWTSSNTLSVGFSGSGSLNVNSGAQATALVSYLGRNTGSTGTATVTGTNSVWNSTDDAWVGNFGQATLNVTAGGRFAVADDMRIAEQTGSVGNMTVSGAGSTLAVGDYLEIVSLGTGSLEINNGASGSAINTVVGEFAGGNGALTVTGANSLMTLTGRIEVGTLGSGALTVSNGGRFTTPNSFVARFAGSSGTATITGTNSRWEHTGVVYIGGTTNASGGNGAVTVANGGLIDADDSVVVWSTGSLALANGTVTTSIFDNQGGNVTGSGLIDSVFFNNAGTISPGASAGLLTVDSGYTQTAAGKLKIELGGLTAGSQYDRLAVIGSAALAGSLELSLIDGFFPPEGSSFDVLTYTSRTGSFSTVTGTNLGNLRFLVPVYQADRLKVYAPRPGDGNLDGFVTGADYTIWADAFGDFPGNAGFQNGDWNGDGFVTGADYTIWADHFTGLPSLPVSVPEPSGCCLALVAMCLGLAARCKARR